MRIRKRFRPPTSSGATRPRHANSLALALLCVATAACAGVGAGAGVSKVDRDDGLRQLTGTEIRQLLIGRNLTFVPDPNRLMVTSQSRERYLADGTLMIAGDRGISRGTYRISADQLCFRLKSLTKEWCRRFFVSTEKHYYLEEIETKDFVSSPMEVNID